MDAAKKQELEERITRIGRDLGRVEAMVTLFGGLTDAELRNLKAIAKRVTAGTIMRSIDAEWLLRNVGFKGWLAESRGMSPIAVERLLDDRSDEGVIRYRELREQFETDRMAA